MSPDPYGWQSFDPGADPLPSSLGREGQDGGEVVVLAVAGEGPDVESWAREAAAALARRWASRTERLFLMDLDLEAPALHRILDVENGEGSSDVFLFGSSIQRVARPVDGGAFYFAAAGTPTVEPERVLRHERWDSLIQGFREAGARLLLHLPLILPGSHHLLDRADRVVVLGRPEEIGPGDPAGLGEAGTVFLHPPEPKESDPDVVGGPEEGPPSENVVDIADLAPDAPSGEVAEAAVTPATAEPDDEVVDIADLAPDGAPVEDPSWASTEDEREVVDIADLAPDREVGAGIADEPPAVESEIVEISDLAPDETVAEETDGPALETPSEPELEATEEDEPAEERELAWEDEETEEEKPERILEEEEEWAEAAGAEADPDEYSDFDLGSLDALAEEPEEEPEEEIELVSGFGEEPVAEDEVDDVVEDEVEAEGAAGFGDFSGDVEEDGFGDAPIDEPADEGEEGFDFGDFGGELEEPGEDEEAEADEGDETDMDLAPSFAEQSGGPAEPAGAAGDDFGDDLVTGADFGGGAPAEEAEWESEEGWDEDTAEVDDESAAAGSTGAAIPTEGGAPGTGAREEAIGERSGEGGAEKPREDEDIEPARRERKSGRPGRLVLLLLLVVVGAGAAHWFGLVRVPGLDRALTSFLGPAGTGSAPVVQATEPEPSTPVMGYSLGVDAYRDVGAASDVASALRERLPDRLFLVAPVQSEGEVFHRLLAGPARNTDEAEALREPLAAVLTRENPDDWVVRATPLAFLVDETSGLESARSRASTLAERGVSAYVLQVEYGDQTVRYRVYAGAYETPDEARAMKGILAQAGISDAIFTERRGRTPE